MITSILSEPNSPTQERSRKNNVASFRAKVLDNDNVLFDVDIEYEYTTYWMGGISVWSFDYTPVGKPNISDKELCEEVKDLIRREEGRDVNFY